MIAAESVGPNGLFGGLMDSLMRLDPADIDAIAQRVVPLIDDRPEPNARLVDAAELASILGVDRSWIYSHAKALNPIRLGGPRGRMRFDLAAVLRSLDAPPLTATRRVPRGAKLMQLGGELLPIDP